VKPAGNSLDNFTELSQAVSACGIVSKDPQSDGSVFERCFLDESGSNADADGNVVAIGLSVGNVSAGTDFQLAVNGRVLIDGERHGFRTSSAILKLLSLGTCACNGKGEGTFFN
jgi:hypothetical protein